MTDTTPTPTPIPHRHFQAATARDSFGIKHASALIRCNVEEVVGMSGIRELGPALALGRRLAGYVDLKNPDLPG